MLHFYLHRYIRLTPAVAAAIFFELSLQRYFGDGPLNKYLAQQFSESCEDYWWSALLHIQNFVNPSDICLEQSGYLSMDFQLFIVFAPFFGTLLWKYGRTIMRVIPVLIFSSMFFIFTISYESDFKVNFMRKALPPEPFLRHIMFSFYAHITPYCSGMMTAYAVERTPEVVIRMKRYLSSTLLWTLSILLYVAVIIGYYPFYSTHFETSKFANAIFLAMSHLVWSISLAWTILACHCGEGGFINKILTLQLWKPLARIGLSIYVTNVSVLLAILGSQEQPVQFDELLNFHHYLGDLGLSFLIGLTVYFLFEAPFISMFKCFKGKVK